MIQYGDIEELKVKDIKIGDRFREDFGDIENLATSISEKGLISPIVLDKDGMLIAGHRRLLAHIRLGWETIRCVRIDQVDERIKREIEVEENIRRKDFSWDEEVKAMATLDKLKRELYGASRQGYGGGWGIQQTADSLSVSVGTVSQDIRLAEALEKYPELKAEKNKSSAWRKFQKMEENLIVSALSEKIQIHIDEKSIVFGKAEVEMKKIGSESVELIVTDPPWGIEIEDSAEGKDWELTHTGGGFGDGKYDVMDLLSLTTKECFRVLKPNSHMYFFFGIQHYREIKVMLEDAGFLVLPVPLVWNKISGGQAGTDYHFPIAYETIFFCMKGKRKLNTLGTCNVFEVERVPSNQKIHPTEKPRRLLRKFIELSSDLGDLIVDPFAGSGSTLIAAMELGRKALGFECSQKHYDSIVVAMNKMREE